MAVLLAGTLLAAFLGVGWWGLGRLTSLSHPGKVTAQAPVPRSPSVSGATQMARTAVVDINTFARTSFAGGTSQQGRPLGAGSGMILTPTGEVLTNNHVIKGATSIHVTVPSLGRTYSATVVGAAPTDDVALLQLEGASALPTVSLTESSALRVGQQLVAIGNAFGRGGTPATTSGTVTALDRTITANGGSSGSEQLHGLIQTDAPIAHGDSGGALVDATGQVVGMITAGHDRPGSSTTRVGFAIASQTAAGIVNQIRAGRSSSSIVIGPAGFLGVQVTDLTAQTASQAGLNITSGAFVVDVVQGTPAADAGIPRFSAITVIDGQRISSTETLGTVLHGRKPGDVVRITWTDANGTHTSSVSLIEGPAI